MTVSSVMDVAIETMPTKPRFDLEQQLRVERAAFAAKVRAARAVLGLSQDQFARHIGLTQKSIHRIEQGAVQPKRQTVLKIQRFWIEQGIVFENLRNGGFRLAVDPDVLLRNQDDKPNRRPRLTVV
jgi:DNA-binding XRE family transcriptional regulator